MTHDNEAIVRHAYHTAEGSVQDVAGFVTHGVPCRANVFHCAVWKNESEFHVEVGALVRRFNKHFSAYPVAILRMNALVKGFVRRYPPLRIEGQQAVIFL